MLDSIPVTDPTFAAMDRAIRHAREHIAGLDSRPVGPTRSVADLRERIRVELPREGIDSARVIDELVQATAGGLLGCSGGRFFAWVIGGALPSALAADWLTSAWDQNTALSATAPALSVVEEAAGDMLKDVLELPRETSFAFTTGCQMAHATALAAARHALLRDAGWDVAEQGLFGAPPIRILVGDTRHASVDRAARLLGFGSRNLIDVETDSNGRMSPRDLQARLPGGSSPAIVVLSAGDLNIGAFDVFDALIPIARASGAWVHVDGAFGLFARVSRSKRDLLNGVELADSWATDAHKWLNVPYDCGMAFVRDVDAHRAAMTVRASYIEPADHARDPIDWGPEFSRRARAVPVYAALRELGRSGLESLVDRTCAHAAAIVDGIGALPGAEILWRPQLNQGLLRFASAHPNATQSDHDRRTDAVIRAINETGEAFFSGATWRGMRVMRVSVVNWRTSEADVCRTIAAASRALQSPIAPPLTGA